MAVGIFTQQKIVNLKVTKTNIVLLGIQKNASMLNFVCFNPGAYISIMNVMKLDGVGPVDNQISTDKLHHFVRKKRKRKKRHMTHDM